MVRGNFGGFLPPLNSIADGALFPRHWIALQTERSLTLFAKWRCGAIISVSHVEAKGHSLGVGINGHARACPRSVYSTRRCGLLSNYFDLLLIILHSPCTRQVLARLDSNRSKRGPSRSRWVGLSPLATYGFNYWLSLAVLYFDKCQAKLICCGNAH